MAENRIEVFPRGDGWRWKKGSKESKKFDSRSEAFEDALIERQTEAIILLRRDGSMHGELYHETRQGPSEPQRIDILAASVREQAEEVS